MKHLCEKIVSLEYKIDLLENDAKESESREALLNPSDVTHACEKCFWGVIQKLTWKTT